MKTRRKLKTTSKLKAKPKSTADSPAHSACELPSENLESYKTACKVVEEGELTTYAVAKRFGLSAKKLKDWCDRYDSEEPSNQPCSNTKSDPTMRAFHSEVLPKARREKYKRAHESVLNGGLTVYEAAKKFGLAESTLQNWHCRQEIDNRIPSGSKPCASARVKIECNEEINEERDPITHTTKLSAEKKEALMLARQLVLDGRMTKYAAAKKYRLPQATLHRWCKLDDINDSLPSVGRPSFLTNELEDLMEQEIIKTMSESGE